MAQDETNAQVDTQNVTSSTAAPQEEAVSSSNSEKESSAPSNVLDDPIESEQDDLIGTKDLQDGLIEYIKRADKPFTIGLQGEWGLGKTSFLNLLKSRLCNDGKSSYYPVWIDACDFTLLQSPSSAVINMLQSMVYQIGNLNPTIAANQQGKAYIEKLMSFITNNGKPAATKIITTGIEAATDGVISEDVSKPVVSSLLSNTNKPNNNQGNTLSVVKKLRNDITNLIKYIFDPDNKANYIFTEDNLQHNTSSTVIQSNQKQDGDETIVKDQDQDQEKQGIVFFIDNLDRIDPTLAVEFLEITKNIFDFEKCIFIIGVDNNILLRGLKAKLGPLDKNNAHVFQAYLDKFVQLSINLGYQGTAVKNLLFQSLKQIHYFNDNELDNLKKDDLTLKDSLFFFSLFSGSCNPRSIKRFTNTLSLILSIKEAHDRNLSKLINIKLPPIDTITKSLIFVITHTIIFNRNVFDIISDKPVFVYYNPQGQDQNNTEYILNDIQHAVSNIDKNNTKLYKPAIQLLQALLSIEKLSSSKDDFNQKLGEVLELTTYLHTSSPFPN